MNLASFPYPEKWPPYVCIRLPSLDFTPTILFIGTLANYEKIEHWRDTKKIYVTAKSDLQDIIVVRGNGAHYIACQETTELLAFSPAYVVSTSFDAILVWNEKNELEATNDSGLSFKDAFFWKRDLVLVDELSLFIVKEESLTIEEQDYGDIIDCAFVEDGELIVRMWDYKEPKKEPKKQPAKKKPAK